MPDNLTVITLNQKDITDFSHARNEQLKKVTTPWVLFLDQDEILSHELKEEIDNLLRQPNIQFSAYKLKRVDTFMGRVLKHGETGHASFVRLAKKDWGKWEGKVHEKWVGNSRVGELKGNIIHTPHQSLSTFINKIDTYSTLAARDRFDHGVHSSIGHIIFYPLLKFKLNYILKLGFLDGVPGLIHAIIMSWHSYLTWTKLYLLWHQK